MPKQTTLVETATITEAAIEAAKASGRLFVQLISPGWGSSGHYSSDVLAEAATNVVIPKGTHMYADHPTPTEVKERPGRSIKDLMSVTVEDARVATADDIATWGADPGALVAEVDVVPSWQPLVEHVKDSIGVSVRGAGELVDGEVDGRSGKIVESFEYCSSVDWVTRAGRGGRALSLMESARAYDRAIAHGISEATVNDTREALQVVLADTYGGDKVYVWVRDFDDTQVWFEVDGADNGIYAQAYSSTDDGAVALSGDRTEVRVKTTYVPVTRPDSNTPTTTESQEDIMGKIQIEESEHSRLTETAGRVDALLEENANLKAENTTLKESDASRSRSDRARTLVAERATAADVVFNEREVKGFLADVTLTEAGQLDEAAFITLVDEDAAAKKAAGGAGSVIGHGGGPLSEAGKVTLDQIDEALGLKTGA